MGQAKPALVYLALSSGFGLNGLWMFLPILIVPWSCDTSVQQEHCPRFCPNCIPQQSFSWGTMQTLFFLLKMAMWQLFLFNVNAYPEQRHFQMPIQAVLQCREECKSHWARESLCGWKWSLPGSSLRIQSLFATLFLFFFLGTECFGLNAGICWVWNSSLSCSRSVSRTTFIYVLSFAHWNLSLCNT